MKHLLTAAILIGAGAAWAVPGTPVVTSAALEPGSRTMKIVYTLPGDEAAVVTLTATVGGRTYDVVHAVGAVNSRVAAGAGRVIHWTPADDVPAATYDPSAISLNLKAWSLSTPPDYMAVSLLAPSCVRYYVSADAVPGGVGDARWKEDWLLLRRIPAKGVTWRAGCASQDYCWGSGEQNATNGFQPLRYVTSPADFYIGVYEVTQGQYMRLANGANPSAVVQSSFTSAMNHYARHQVDWKWHPAEQVTWTLADAAAASLAAASGLPFGLPTAEDWEFAARAETQWGTYNGAPHNPDRLRPIACNYQTQNAYYGGTQNVQHPQYACHMPVGELRPNAYGLYDMVGNVGEWCAGWFDAGQTTRPIKGGDLHMSGEGLGVGYTRGMAPATANFRYGFRLACAIP